MFGQGRIKTWHEQALFDVTLFPNNTDNNDTSWTRKDDTMFAEADPVISFNQFSHSINFLIQSMQAIWEETFENTH